MKRDKNPWTWRPTVEAEQALEYAMEIHPELNRSQAIDLAVVDRWMHPDVIRRAKKLRKLSPDGWRSLANACHKIAAEMEYESGKTGKIR